ncbi:MAG: SAM-dependent methyltransferase, partial [Wenzhouxiangellaceae bacterium]
MSGPGRLVVAGWGLQPGRHVSVRTLSEIEHADVVFALGDGLALEWLRGIHPDVRDLGVHYDAQVDRRRSYRAMQREILDALAPGRGVCALFYGHPAVFAQVGRKTLAAARGA